MTPGIKDIHRHMASIVAIIQPDAVSRELRASVKAITLEAAFGIGAETIPKRFEKFEGLLRGIGLSIPDGQQRSELMALFECVSRPEWRNAAPPSEDDWPVMRGVYDHFKGGIYKLRNISTWAEDGLEVVEYTVLKTGKDTSRYLWQWDEVVKWPDGKYRSRFVYRGPDTTTLEPEFKVHA